MNRKIVIVLLGLVVALVMSNVMLGMMAIEIYQTYNALRRDPLGLFHEKETQPGDYDYFLIGDSLIERWKIHEYSVVNQGISAQTSGQVRYRMMLLGKGIRAKKSIIGVGGNDLKILRVDPALAPKIIDMSLSNIRDIIQLSKHMSDQTFIVTVPPMYTVPFYLKPFKFTHVMLSALEKLNAGIIDVAEDEGVTVINCEQALRGMTTPEILAADKIHLSEKAYETLFSEIHQNYHDRPDNSHSSLRF